MQNLMRQAESDPNDGEVNLGKGGREDTGLKQTMNKECLR